METLHSFNHNKKLIETIFSFKSLQNKIDFDFWLSKLKLDFWNLKMQYTLYRSDMRWSVLMREKMSKRGICIL